MAISKVTAKPVNITRTKMYIVYYSSEGVIEISDHAYHKKYKAEAFANELLLTREDVEWATVHEFYRFSERI